MLGLLVIALLGQRTDAADTNSNFRIIGTNLYDFGPIIRENPTSGPFVIQGTVVQRADDWLIVEQEFIISYELNDSYGRTTYDEDQDVAMQRSAKSILAAQGWQGNANSIPVSQYLSLPPAIKPWYYPWRIIKTHYLSLSPNEARVGQQIKSYGIPTYSTNLVAQQKWARDRIRKQGSGSVPYDDISRHTFGKAFTGDLKDFSARFIVSSKRITFETTATQPKESP